MSSRAARLAERVLGVIRRLFRPAVRAELWWRRRSWKARVVLVLAPALLATLYSVASPPAMVDQARGAPEIAPFPRVDLQRADCLSLAGRVVEVRGPQPLFSRPCYRLGDGEYVMFTPAGRAVLLYADGDVWDAPALVATVESGRNTITLEGREIPVAQVIRLEPLGGPHGNNGQVENGPTGG